MVIFLSDSPIFLRYINLLPLCSNTHVVYQFHLPEESVPQASDLLWPGPIWSCSKSATNCYLTLGSLFTTIWRTPASFLGYSTLVENILQELLTKHSWEVNLRPCLFGNVLIYTPTPHHIYTHTHTHLTGSVAGSRILSWDIIFP